MRPFTRVKPKRATPKDPYCVIPIPPKSIVQLTIADRSAPAMKEDHGRVFRIGYYYEQDGLDCIWLVNDLGEYEQTTDHDCLFDYFDIIMISDETDLYGKKRPQFPPIRRAQRTGRAGKKGSLKGKKGTA